MPKPTSDLLPGPKEWPASRRWLFRCLMMLGVPLLLACLLEASLRLYGFGHPTAFLLRKEVRGQMMLVDNPWFGLRFFPPALARSPNPVCIRATKPPGTFRIFLFGESAALGDPRPSYGVGRYLEALLTRRFPATQFEVVCVAMTAINSHAVLPIARECARYHGDLWIVYMGNNEFAGPFGANTVFGPQAPPAWAVRVFLAFQTTRVGQCLVALARRVHTSPSAVANWGGLKMFLDHQLPPQDLRRQRVYQNFEKNLQDIVLTAKRAHVPLVLSTVATNLKDCAPFGSFPRSEAIRQAPAEWQKARDAAEGEARQGNISKAIDQFRKAVELEPACAELQFRLGQSLMAATNHEAARQSFSRARDLDTLPFRADTRINEVITGTASHEGSNSVAYVDAERELAGLSPSHIPGSECFYEHVHLNWTGNYQLALAFAQQVAKQLPETDSRQQRATWAEPAECAKVLGLTDWNRYPALEEILRRLSEPPFTEQLSHDSQAEHLTNALLAVRQRMQSQAIPRARSLFEATLKQRPEDHWLHHNYAEFLTGIGALQEAAGQMREVCELVPENHAGYLQLGRILAHQKNYPDAQVALETALRLRPDVFDVRVELGQVLAAQDKLNEALDQYTEAQRCHGGEDARVCLLQGDVLARQRRTAEAIDRLRLAVSLRPGYTEAHELLGIELATDGQFPAAQAEFEEVVRLRPDYAEGHLNLGIALARQRRFREALDQLDTTLRLDPQNAQARSFISSIRELQPRATAP